MSIDGGSVDSTEDIGYLQTADDLKARAAEILAQGAEPIEIENISSFFRDIPPELSSTLYPQDFLNSKELPDAGNSYATLHGVYSAGNIALAGRQQFLDLHPEEKFKPDPNASLSSPFKSASNISSLVDSTDPEYDNNGPDFPRFG